MIESVRVAALQLAAHDRDAFVHSLDRILAEVRRAASDSQLVVLPEGTFPAYVVGHAPIERQAVDDAVQRLRAIAAETRAVIVAGTIVHAANAQRNAAIVIDADGSIAGRADKLFLWHFDRRWFAAGESLSPIPTQIGTLGVFVCADGRLPTIARTLVDRGADVLVMPTAWVTSGRDPAALENVQADLLARVRAYENGVPFVAANKCGSELGMVAYCGKSQIVDANGNVVAIAGEREPQTVEAAIALGRGRPHRSALAEPADMLPPQKSLRLAISADALPSDIDDRLEVLDDAYALAPHDAARLKAIAQAVPTAGVDDDTVLDPGGLVPYRRAGYALILWTTRLDALWAERLARARALELRLYVVVFDESQRRAYAVDPDGAIVAGTFGGFRLASFLFDARKVADSVVAPGTDVAEGLERVAALL